MARIFEYFVVCGLGPEIRTLDGTKGYHGTEYLYLPSLLDQYPPLNHTLYPPPPPQLSTCVLPAGVELFPSGFDSNDPLSHPRSYPIVLTEGDGSKIYVSCITFRDPVCEDIAEAYRIPPNSFADKCICIVSRSPCFRVLREALEEIFALCFSPSGSSKPLWDVIAHMVSNVPLPTPGKERVLFAIDNCLLSVEVPPKDGLPQADISFQPLVQCLDVDNLIKLFTAVLLERRILIRSNVFTSDPSIRGHMPFDLSISVAVRWAISITEYSFGVDYIDAPTPYMMGLHSGVDTSNLGMDGVVIVDLEFNQITATEEIPPIPEPELSLLRGEILKLLHPNVVGIDLTRANFCGSSDQNLKIINKPWGEDHDLQLSSPSISSLERAAERERMVLDIQVKLQGLWLRLLKLEAGEDPLSSFEYGTILALIESDAEGIGGSGFVVCIREHINSGWHGQLTEEQFIAVKELLKTAISRATSRNDVLTIRDALEVSAEMYKKDANNVPDYVQRHLISLSIWEELRKLRQGSFRFWEGYFDYLVEQSSDKSANYAALVTAQLIVLASHMAGLGLPDNDAWYIIEIIAERNNIGYKLLIKLRGLLSHIHQLRINYWGVSSGKPQLLLPPGLSSPRLKDAADENQEPLEASGVGRSWVQSMFSRDTSSRTNSFSRVRKWASDGATENGNARKQDMPSAGQKKTQTNVRILRGHSGPVTALHCVTRKEVWDLVGDREDAGFFISGSTDCTVKIWDPSLRGSELRATLQGHTRTVRAISSDRGKVVSGSDDLSVIVWDKQTTQLLEELKGHDAQVSCVRMLSGERVLTAAHDGTVKMWDVRTDTCVATVGRCSSAVLCMEYDDTTGILAAAGRDAVANIWDIRAGRQMHKLLGHTKWIRSIRMVGDTLITGSDDWTARVWTVSRGTCDAVLACHAGPLLCVEYSASDKGIITGSTDGLLRFWENDEEGIKCVKNVTIHTAPILSINAGEQWLGVGAADNSMSLFQRPQERLGVPNTGSKMSGWQLYRTPQKTNAVVRCVVSDLERKRICGGGRNGVLRLWEATINI
ncbi:hypothetical protein GOBAR_AA38945 [Gossypium barbadense]|uniref:UDENN domain-containing protein n=1 Tax=Gossypium barbadense TaxID=3634 RepID=A0A2P5VSJ5_GOSBA|nr:hypothetical protein GOBAR_AA38945 [Gossypium barbadense]